jgi:hypothetical protein
MRSATLLRPGAGNGLIGLELIGVPIVACGVNDRDEGLCAEYGPHVNACHPPRWCWISVSTRVMWVLKGTGRY